MTEEQKKDKIMIEEEKDLAHELRKIARQKCRGGVVGGANPKLALWAQDNFGPAQKRPSTLERVGEGFYALSRRKRITFHKSRKETKNEQDGE